MQDGQIFQQRYQIDREVGRGSFGIVYAAVDLQSGQTVAIKILLPWVRSDEGLRHRLKREARLTGMLANEHAVRILDIDETPDGDLYLVMEFLDGVELTMLLAREGRLKPERATDIGRQALEALSEAHRLGVIHRDVKPHNIFLCRDGSGRDFVKMLDFGIAKVAGTGDGTGLAETTRLTAPGNILGTPSYMSPEQCRGEPLTPASDFYSLGIVLYEMASGHVPFYDNNPMQVLMMHNTQPVPPLSAFVAGLPIGQAISRALEKDPQQRFPNADDFIAALDGRQTLAAAQQAARVSTGTMVMSAIGKPGAGEAVAAKAAAGKKERGAGAKGLFRRYWLALVIVALLAVVVASQLL